MNTIGQQELHSWGLAGLLMVVTTLVLCSAGAGHKIGYARDSKTRSIIKKILAALPFKKQMVRVAALLPCGLKNRVTVRVFGAMLRLIDGEFDIMTNLGISNRIRIPLKSNASPTYLFGSPSTYTGERGGLMLVKHLAPSCRWFIDIGANIGYYTHFVLHNAPQTRVAVFEPMSDLFLLINSTVLQHKFTQQVSLYKRGVSDTTGTAEFYIDQDDPSMGSLLGEFGDRHQLTKCTIDVMRYDDFASELLVRGDVIVKVDIENAEHLFINGACESLKSIRYLVIELLNPARQAKILERLINEFGFYAYYINDFSLEHMLYEDHRYSPGEFNWLFCRESPTQLALLLENTEFRIVGAPAELGLNLNHRPYRGSLSSAE